jgi:hypothetical protein
MEVLTRHSRSLRLSGEAVPNSTLPEQEAWFEWGDIVSDSTHTLAKRPGRSGIIRQPNNPALHHSIRRNM